MNLENLAANQRQSNDPMRMQFFNMDNLFADTRGTVNQQPMQQPIQQPAPQQAQQAPQQPTPNTWAIPEQPKQEMPQGMQMNQPQYTQNNPYEESPVSYDPNKCVAGMLHTVSIDPRCFLPGTIVHLSKTHKQSGRPIPYFRNYPRNIIHYANTRIVPDEIEGMVRYCNNQFMTVVVIDSNYAICELLVTLYDMYDGVVEVTRVYIDGKYEGQLPPHYEETQVKNTQPNQSGWVEPKHTNIDPNTLVIDPHTLVNDMMNNS